MFGTLTVTINLIIVVIDILVNCKYVILLMIDRWLQQFLKSLGLWVPTHCKINDVILYIFVFIYKRKWFLRKICISKKIE